MTKKLQPKLRFRGFTDAWEQRKLGEIAEIGTGSHNTQDGCLDGRYPFFIRSDQKLFLDDYDYDEEAILIPGDGRIGQIYHYVNGKYALHQRVYRIKVGLSVDTRFVLYLMESRFRKHALAMNSQGTVPSLRKPIFTEWDISLPEDRGEQVRISTLFDQLDSLIVAEKRKLNLLRGKKSALLSQIFDQKMRFKGYTDPWEQRKLGEVCSITMGQSPNGKAYTTDSNYHILVQGNADIVDGWVRPRVWTKEVTKKAEAGDLILSVRAPVGAVAKTAFPVVLGRGVAGIDGGEYVYQFLRMLEERKYWRTIASGSTFDSVTKEQVAELPIEKPESRQEEHQIGVLLHTFDDLIAAESRKIDLLELKKKSLLQRMFV